ncbi:hypothetical protein ACFQ2Y_48195 [Streptomyces malaysiensis subsp. malaysiensis]
MEDTTAMDVSEQDDARLLQRYIDACSNWGRWGEDDQIGTLNLVGPEQVRRAARLARQGRTISLSLPYDQSGPQPGGFRNNPQLYLTATGTDHVTGAQDVLPAGWGPAKGWASPTMCW